MAKLGWAEGLSMLLLSLHMLLFLLPSCLMFCTVVLSDSLGKGLESDHFFEDVREHRFLSMRPHITYR